MRRPASLEKYLSLVPGKPGYKNANHDERHFVLFVPLPFGGFLSFVRSRIRESNRSIDSDNTPRQPKRSFSFRKWVRNVADKFCTDMACEGLKFLLVTVLLALIALIFAHC